MIHFFHCWRVSVCWVLLTLTVGGVWQVFLK